MMVTIMITKIARVLAQTFSQQLQALGLHDLVVDVREGLHIVIIIVTVIVLINNNNDQYVYIYIYIADCNH